MSKTTCLITTKKMIDISKELNVPLDTIKDKVTKIIEQKYNEINTQQKLSNTEIKSGVSELFESNPELANSVYETLGFSQETNNFYEDNIKPKPNTIFAFGRNVSIRDASNPYKKTDPSKNPDVAFVFTENAQAYAAYTPSMRSGDRILASASPETVKLNVSDMAGSATPNTAGIRSINGKTKQPNVFGIVVKKYQQLNGIGSRFVAKEGQFNDTDSDFMTFQAFNRSFFESLQLSRKKEIVMPGSIALGRSALPFRFAEWLQKEINNRLGVNYSIAKTETAGYDGYGLKFNPETNRNTVDRSLNGYTGLEMIDMFTQAGNIPSNIIFSKEWVDTGKFGNIAQNTYHLGYTPTTPTQEQIENKQKECE